MFTEINEKINGFADAAKEEKSIKNKLKVLEEKIRNSKEELLLLNKKVEKEYRDVKNLEKNNLSNFLANVLGKVDMKIEKEQREYFEVKSLYEKCERNLEDYKIEESILKERLKVVKPLSYEYKELIFKKYNMILDGDSEEKIRIIQLEDRIKEIKNEKVQLNEALKETDNCMPILDDAKRHLVWAQNLGHLDMASRGKGGMLTSMIKQAKMREAKKCLEDLNFAMKKLNEELEDVNIRIFIEGIEVDYFTSVLDIFVDNFYTDLAVQDKIRNSLNNVSNLRDRVYDIAKTVRQREEDILLELESKEIELDNILLKA
ncbi:MAG: hypothetical protein ACRDCB_00760 [Clostridium sp.]|uniref:hypothetical protein n=1 Tax=Clostridium TaxID=1485 RepID=UPI0021522DCE|nr:hypothetical protein [Clostridium sp. LY3-2]MCR6515626.1 hypothetical protein [Clostridium sp. LY3-2]